jgi:hypothetical protein
LDRYIVPVFGLVLPIGNGLAGAFRSRVGQGVTTLYAELSAVEAARAMQVIAGSDPASGHL